jgi:hypothetical protein
MSAKEYLYGRKRARPRGGMEPAPPFICGSRPRTKSPICNMTVFVPTPRRRVSMSFRITAMSEYQS